MSWPIHRFILKVHVGKEYKISFKLPAEYDPKELFRKLPSPIHRQVMDAIYDFRIESDGFYFLDSLVDNDVASIAFRCFVDEALAHCEKLEIIEL